MRLLIEAKPGFEARVIFMLFGFTNKNAFINVCQDIDKDIDYRDLSLLWDLGLTTLELENRMLKIIETLKQE